MKVALSIGVCEFCGINKLVENQTKYAMKITPMLTSLPSVVVSDQFGAVEWEALFKSLEN